MYNSLAEYIEHDKPITVLLTILGTLTVIMLALTSIAIWPAVIYGMTTENIFRLICRNVLVANVFVLIAEGICTFLLMMFDKDFYFRKMAIINFFIGSMANMVILLCQSGLFLSNTGVDFMIALLWFFLSFFLSLILALLPSLILAGIAKAAYTTLVMINDQKR
ncbi:MAG: hypothetical protein IJ381_08850 [Clostridia bacterium]|nr:hypothetical protein [Clostridia bacterium]